MIRGGGYPILLLFIDICTLVLIVFSCSFKLDGFVKSPISPLLAGEERTRERASFSSMSSSAGSGTC